jgi:hypothetical protein
VSIDDIIDLVASFEGTLVQLPREGDGTPEIAWGDAFFFYAPDGRLPEATQPFATVVTKDYPGDSLSQLDPADRFRVNVAAGREVFVEWAGHDPREPTGEVDYTAVDVVMPHPVYGEVGWLSVVNPGPATDDAVRDLLRRAYELARGRAERRAELA